MSKSNNPTTPSFATEAEIRELRERMKGIVFRMYRFFPFWGLLTENCKVSVVDGKAKGIPTACVDAQGNISFDKDFFKNLSDDQALFVLAHEVGHAAFSHIDRRSTREPFMWNVAIDYAINLLRADNFSDNKYIPADLLLDRKYEGMSAEQIYEDIRKNAKKVKAYFMSGDANFGGGGGGEVVRREFDFPGQYIAVTPGAAISVTVGAGGSGGTAGTPATNGADSVFDSLTAKGGGGGGSTDSGTGIGAAGLAGAGGGGGAPNTTGNTGGAGGAATNAGCSGCVGGDGKGVTEGSAVYVGGGGGGGNNNGSIEKEGRSPSVGSGCVNNDGGTGSRLQLAEWLVPNTDNMSMGSGGGGGCAAYGTPAGAYARTANFRGGQYFFGVWYGNPESGAANTGQGGGGGADYGVTGGAGGSGLVAIWYVPGGGATGGPTVTPPSPVVADGTNPVVFDVPATITEGASPIDSGATCIVDPATLACGTQVTLPTQGTWVLDVGAGTLTFTAFPTATPGATESVVLRVTDTGGATAEGTFSVVIPDGSVRPGFTG